MLIVNADKIKQFRLRLSFDVFKECYSDEYSNFSLSDNKDCLLAKTKGQKIPVAIFIYEKPTDAQKNAYSNCQIHVYYIVKQPDEKGLFKHKLKDQFTQMISEQADSYFSKVDQNSVFLREYQQKKPSTESQKLLYKYYSGKMEDEEKQKEILQNGMIGFSDPTTFNDPFDCDYQNKNDKKGKEQFRVLCLTSDPYNILMWSYYGNNHKGYCLGYAKDEILDALDKQYKGICFIGEVEYKSKRPAYKVTKALGKSDEIFFEINCLFTKYDEWKHEREYRMVVIPSDNCDPHYSLFTTIHARYEGCCSDNHQHSYVKLSKDSQEYKLKKD